MILQVIMKNRCFFSITLILLNLLIINPAFTQDNYGVINFELLKESIYDQYNIDSIQNDMSNLLNDLIEVKIENLREEYQKYYVSCFSHEQARKKERYILEKKEEIEKLGIIISNEIPTEQNELNLELKKSVKDFLKINDITNSYKLILFSSSVAFVKSDIDITNQIINDFVKCKLVVEIVENWNKKVLEIKKRTNVKH